MLNKQIIEIIKNRSIIGFGEATYGQYKIENKIFDIYKSLVLSHGFTIFILEENYFICKQINDFIKNNIDINFDIQIMAFSWKTKNMYNFIKWMKEYNKTHNNILEFIGLDIALPLDTTIKLFPKNNNKNNNDIFVLKKIKQYHTKSIKLIKSLNLLESDYDQHYHNTMRQNNNMAIDKNKNKNKPISYKINNDVNTNTNTNIDNKKKMNEYIYEEKISNLRDKIMFDIFLKIYSSEKKYVLCFQNSHIEKHSYDFFINNFNFNFKRLGNFLFKTFQDKYVSIGNTFFTGSYMAIDINKCSDDGICKININSLHISTGIKDGIHINNFKHIAILEGGAIGCPEDPQQYVSLEKCNERFDVLLIINNEIAKKILKL